MATTSDLNRARKEGYDEGYADAIARVRAFTGVDPFAPDLDEPEHVAYPKYLDQLSRARQVAFEGSEDATAEIRRLQDQLARAEGEEGRELRERRDDRAGRNPIVKLTAAVGDKMLPITKEIRHLKRRVAAKEAWRSDCEDRADAFAAEEAKVSQWVDDYLADADRIRLELVERAERERFDQECADRDISPRWCQVLRHEDFTAEGRHRRGAFTFDDGLRDVGGADFGYQWRRDVDELNGLRGRWALHYIPESHETFLEYMPRTKNSAIWLLGDAIDSFDEALDLFVPLEPHQSERNSIALILDAYEEHRAAKARL